MDSDSSLATRLSLAALRTRLGRQVATHFLGQAVFAGAGFASTLLLTHTLPVREFGSYVFVISSLLLTNLLFEWGLWSSASRLIAVAESEEDRRRRMGAILRYGLRLGLAFALCYAGAALVALSFGSHLPGEGIPPETARLMLVAAPFLLGYPLLDVLGAIAQGANRITLLSMYTAAPRLILLAGIGLLVLVHAVSAVLALVLTLGSALAAGLAMALVLRPQLRGIEKERDLLKTEILEFGRQVYHGRIVDGLTNGLDKILLSMYHGMPVGGVYSIALTLTSPISMVSRGVAVSAYSRFPSERSIPRPILTGNLLWCIGGTLLVVLAAFVFVPLLFPAKYQPALAVLPLLALGTALAGLNAPYHSFLQARRKGRVVRRMSITTSLVSVGGNLLMVPLWGMQGAAWALIACYGVNLLFNLFTHHALSKEGMKKDEQPE